MGNSSNPPWQQGYALAEELHDDLDDCMDGEPGKPVDVEAILDRLGVDVTEASLSDASIRGVAIAGPHHRSGILWNRNNHFNADVRGQRFTLAHELCHLLFDRNAGQRLAVASGPWAPPSLEKRANAFAAMLLMPTETIRALAADMDEPIATAQDVSRVAERLQTGFSATLWHLQNLGFVDDISMQRIEAKRQRL
ncbi:MAG: ImmA/IrrE family metallo-endopeptidase [Aphanocapsa feldmannii 277cV]|uniref:ImmA/IrrE family metallo-endopeptidase n=1 Tax=Aphanocapsa feldmannii 277cV TaxID=2507553 RepID=A0A524RM77_9CHRO|nr:MAG: ImmA/IrrE family metallo-endopeptidase [Aphanocapsa feldmannii 277cV]